MEYETSYDLGVRPFNHDKNRGKWESPKDFLFACVGHAFKLDVVMAFSMMIFETFGVFALIPYLIILSICVVPILIIQSFLGQFSSTGYISVFRISPIFKGIGYASLFINFVALTYCGVFSAIPFLFLVHSLRPTIPWSCEGATQWMNTNETICDPDLDSKKIPSVEFYRDHMNLNYKHYGKIHFSAQLMLLTVVIWTVVTFILLKPTELIGRFMRYSFMSIIVVMAICLMRFIFLQGALDGLLNFLVPTLYSRHSYIRFEVMIFIPILALSTMGPGWGSILTMASYNNFKTNIFQNTWMMSLIHLGVIIGMGLLAIFLKNSVDRFDKLASLRDLPEWTAFLTLPSALTFMELPNFWSLLFFGMLTLGTLNLLVIQLFSLLTSIFDEFEILREFRRPVTIGIVAILMITSTLFCSNHGIFFLSALSKLSVLAQVILNLLLILLVLWIYGRERFQRDLNFMTSEIFPTWKVYVVRFVAPVVLALGFMLGMFHLVLSLIFGRNFPSYGMELIVFGVSLYLLPWSMIPIYMVIRLTKISGNVWTRLQKCAKPTDWYPADPDDKQRYEERFSSTDISQPLSIVLDE